MTLTIIQERLKNYKSLSKQEELSALKEIYQEIALSGLARSDFFKLAAFQGGTALDLMIPDIKKICTVVGKKIRT